jgi:hypothetical protein
MMWQRSRIALLACGVLASLTVSVRADDCCAPSAPAVQYRTVCVTEWVPEYYQATRTAWKSEVVPQTYTAYRTEMVPTQQTRTYLVSKCVPEVQTRTRIVCTPVTEVQPRTITRCVVNCVPVTTMCTRTVDRGHYECREVVEPCAPAATSCGHGGRLGGLFRGRNHGSCAAPCGDDCGPTYVTRTVRVWVPNCVTESYPVTRMQRQVSYVNETVNVTVCKMVPKEETYQVTVNKIVCEPRTETVTVNVCKMVPYEATRMVTRCVPVTENYTACRMVPRTVERQVACYDSYGDGMGSYGYGMGSNGCGRQCSSGHRLFGGRRGGCCH